MSDDPILPSHDLGAVFAPEQVAALDRVIREIHADRVTRAEFERLEALVRELLSRLPPRAPEAAPQATTEVTPEEVVIIAATVTSYLGKKVRVRAARRLPSPPRQQSAWGYQGRVFVQASHDLGAPKGR
jgi:hypothetical protein